MNHVGGREASPFVWEVLDAQLPHWEMLWQWDWLKKLVASGGMDRTALDQGLTKFYQRVEETRDRYQCLVREQEGGRVVGV